MRAVASVRPGSRSAFQCPRVGEDLSIGHTLLLILTAVCRTCLNPPRMHSTSSAGARIRHVGYKFATSNQAYRLYNSLNHLLFNPVLPYYVITKKDGRGGDLHHGRRLPLVGSSDGPRRQEEKGRGHSAGRHPDRTGGPRHGQRLCCRSWTSRSIQRSMVAAPSRFG